MQVIAASCLSHTNVLPSCCVGSLILLRTHAYFLFFFYVKGSAPSRTGTIPSDYIQLLERPRSSSAPNGRHFNPGTSAVIPPPLTRSQSGNSIIQSTGGNSVPTDPRNSPGHQQQQSPVSTNANETSTPSGITLNTTVQIIQVNFRSNSILLSKKILRYLILISSPLMNLFMNQTNSTERNKVKNPIWQEVNQLAIYKCDQGFVIAS